MTEQNPQENAPVINWAHMHESEHFVQFYEDPAYLFDSVSAYVGAGLESETACLVLAAAPHLKEVERRLRARGLDLSAARRKGQYVSFEGAATLQKLLVNGRVDRNVFFDVVGQAVKTAKSRYPQVRVFGELVAMLCEHGQYDQAHALEGFWNELGSQHSFALFCAYPVNCFSSRDHAEAFAHVCADHARIIPSESYSELENASERLEVIGKLQQRAKALEREVELRRQAEQNLIVREKELSDFLENAADALHKVDANGVILWANKAELDLLGYAREEYIGRHFADFHADAADAGEFFAKLLAGETLRDQHGKVVRKDGSVRDVLITSNAYWENGKFIYSRCITRDVTAQYQAESASQEQAKAEREAQEKLLQLNEVLEERVRERTEDLRRSELQFSRLVEGVADYAIYMLDANGYIVSWNTGAKRIKGYTEEEIIGKHFSLFYTDEDREAGTPQRALKTASETGKYEAEAWRVRKDGTRFWASVLLDAIHSSDGELLGFAKVTRDMTERRALEETLRQSQKMEAIGQLTGGVAHDFNNLLTVIIGNLETIARNLPNASPRLSRSIDLATRGAQRAATLTQQLLAFSRKQPLNPKPTDINRVVVGMSDLLRRSLGENIRIETVLAGGLWRTEIDSHQLESALLNLAVNARDAMQNGGTLAIETANACIDALVGASYAELPPGDYVCISVSDTGVGMDAEVLSRAFEPFFTTKPLGQGTGLGLSQVYGFIKQSGGSIKLYSEPQHGTTVKVYLRRLIATADEEIEAPAPARLPQGNRHETILVVEDDQDVRLHSTDSLRELGFTVLEAPDAPSALRMLEEHPEVQLLFTDVGLPGMNGRELVEQVRMRRPTLRVLFTSGYARNAIMHQGRLEAGVELLSKPFTRAQLAFRVREVLDTSPVLSGKQARILVVDDEALVRSFLADTLREMGFQVVEADTVAAALGAARDSEPFDAALVDLGLPDRSGLELIDELKTLRPQLPVLIASGYGDMVQRDARDADRRPRFLTKPYNAAAITQALNELGIRIPKRLLN